MDVLVACKEVVSLKQVYWVVSETRQPMTCCFLWFRISYGGSYPVPPLMSPPSSYSVYNTLYPLPHTLYTLPPPPSYSVYTPSTSLILCTLPPPPSYSVHFLHLPHTLYTLPPPPSYSVYTSSTSLILCIHFLHLLHTLFAPRYPKRDSLTSF
jgi:hypothetical protein